MTQWYSSPSGVGNGLTTGTPFQNANAWAVIQPGDTLTLLDGVFTGPSGMLLPPTSVKGTAGARITIKALNDGMARINAGGLFDSAIHLQYAGSGDPGSGNNYITVEGINFHSAKLYVVRNAGAYNIFRRCIAWDAGDDPGGSSARPFQSNGYHCLVEDCASFGSGRYTVDCAQMDAGVGGQVATFRRHFSVFMGSGNVSPQSALNYWYNSDPVIWENCIATWNYSSPGNSQGIIYAASAADSYVHIGQAKLLGCIAYLKAGQGAKAAMSGISAQMNRKVTIQDCIAYLDPAHAVTPMLPLDFRAHNPNQGNVPPYNLNLINVTGIGAGASTINSDWSQSNVKTGTSLVSVYGSESLFVNNGSKGATVCKRYQDGSLTADPLWPWPMNARIIAAMGIAGYAAIDVTADIEGIFGTIPSVCRTGDVTPTDPDEPDVAPGPPSIARHALALYVKNA